jgi:phosphate transport system substrate-binding protein
MRCGSATTVTLSWVLPFVLLLLGTTASASGAVTLYGVGEYSLVGALSSVAASYSYHRDTVTVAYVGTPNVTTVLVAFNFRYSQYAALDSSIDTDMLEPDTMQLPLFGSGIVFNYNLGPSTPTQSLVFDAKTMGRIWSGDITNWNDSAIASLNEDTPLPSDDIILCWGSTTEESITQTFKRGLRAMSPEFDAALTAANDDLGSLPPILAGRGVAVATNSSGRINCTQATPYSLTYSDWASALKHPNNARMRNNAGKDVAISVTSLQAAMKDFQALLQDGTGDLLIPLFDGEGDSSYPFAYMSTVLIVKEGNQSDCTMPQEMTQYLSWIYTNQHVSDHMSTQGWAPLTVAYRKMIIDELGIVTCDGEEVLTTAYLIGEGTSRPALSDLAGQYPSSVVAQKYFTSDMATAIVDMKQRAIDYADVTTGVTASQLSGTEVANMDIVPVLGYAVFPCYNVPTCPFSLLSTDHTISVTKPWCADEPP